MIFSNVLAVLWFCPFYLYQVQSQSKLGATFCSWRCIRYADDTEELYDHGSDPNEWHNVTGQPTNAKTIDRLKRWLPTTEALPAPDMKRP